MAYKVNKSNSEEELAFRIATYLRTHYPFAIYHFDFGSGVKLTMGQAVKQKRLNKRSFPDLFVAHPVSGYHGLFIELKREGARIRKVNGDYVNDHVAEQAQTLEALADAGYIAQFATGYDEACLLIDSYMSGNGADAIPKMDDPQVAAA